MKKSKCRILKEIRKDIAKENDIECATSEKLNQLSSDMLCGVKASRNNLTKYFMRIISLLEIALLTLFCSCGKEERGLTNEGSVLEKNIIEVSTDTCDEEETNLTITADKDTIDLSLDDGERQLTNEISAVNKNIFDIATRVYDKAQLSEIVNFNGSMNELNEQYPIECLKEYNGIYRASYLGDCCFAVILFDDNGEKIISRIYEAYLLKSDFDMIAKGQSLEDVLTIDPIGEYLFLYTGRNDTPRISYHYTKDGYLIMTEYNDSNSIIRISKELI